MQNSKKNNRSTTIPRSLKELGRLMRFQKGEMLFSAQDEARGFYYVETGEIRVYKMDVQGKEVEVVRLVPGDFLGEAIIFVSSVFPVYAQASKDADVLFFDKGRIQKAMEEDPSISKFFVNLLAKKCVILSNRIESLELKTVRQRLILYLLSNCSGEQKCLVDLDIKKGELAKILGTINETLSRNFKQLHEDGLIVVQGNKIFIKNCPALKKELKS